MYLYARSVRRPPYPIYLYARSASRPPYPIYLYAGSASRPPCPIYLCAGSAGRPPYPIYLCAVRMKTNLSFNTAGARNGSVHVSWFTRCTRVRSNNLSTQLRSERKPEAQRLTLCLPLAVVADPRQLADSAQIRVATIALHAEQQNTRNLQEAHVSQRRTVSFLAGSPFVLLLWDDLHFCHNCHYSL